MTPYPDWRHQYVTVNPGEKYRMPWVDDPRLVTAPRTAEQALYLISAGVSALDGVSMTDEERERVWRLIEKAKHAVGEKT